MCVPKLIPTIISEEYNTAEKIYYGLIFPCAKQYKTTHLLPEQT